MIRREYYTEREDGIRLIRTYSDTNHLIRKVGTNEIYEEAVDVESCHYEYEETEDTFEPFIEVAEIE